MSDAILCCLDNNDRTSCYVVILLNEIPVEQPEMKPSHSYRDAHEFSVFEFELKQSRLTDPVSRKSIPFPMRVLDKSCTQAHRHTCVSPRSGFRKVAKRSRDASLFRSCIGRNAISSHAHHEAGRSPTWRRTTRCA